MIYINLDTEFYCFNSKDVLYFNSYIDEDNIYCIDITFKYYDYISLCFYEYKDCLYYIDLLKSKMNYKGDSNE